MNSMPKPVRIFVGATWALIGLVVILALIFHPSGKSAKTAESSPASSNSVAHPSAPGN